MNISYVEEAWNTFWKLKWLILIILFFSVVIPPRLNMVSRSTYESRSLIDLGVNHIDVDLIAKSKAILESPSVVGPVVDEFYEDIDIDSFKSDYLITNIITESTGRNKVAIPFLEIYVKADSMVESNDVNRKLVEGYLDYMGPEIEMKKESLSKKLKVTNITINRLEEDIEQIKTAIKRRERQRIQTVGQSKSWANQLLSTREKQLNTEMRFVDLQRKLFNLKTEYTIITEPTIVSGEYGNFEANSILKAEETRNSGGRLDIKPIIKAKELVRNFVIPYDANVSIITEYVETDRTKTFTPYLLISSFAETAEEAKEINQEILNGFFGYIEDIKEIDKKAVSEKLIFTNSSLETLEESIEVFKEELFSDSWKPLILRTSRIELRELYLNYLNKLDEVHTERANLMKELDDLRQPRIIHGPEAFAKEEIRGEETSSKNKMMIGLIIGLCISGFLVLVVTGWRFYKKKR